MPSRNLLVSTLIVILLLAACGTATPQPTNKLPIAEIATATETPSTDELLAEQIATWEAGSDAGSESNTQQAIPTPTLPPETTQPAPEDWRLQRRTGPRPHRGTVRA